MFIIQRGVEMENIKKALDVLDNVKVFWSPSQIQEIDLAINVLKKHIPRKPILEICPICEGDLKRWYNEKQYKYCPECGQKLDWN